MKYLLLSILLPLSVSAQRSCPSWGPYLSTIGFQKDSCVLMMADVMFPSNGIAPYTYASSINFHIGASGGYCGIQQAGFDEKRKGNNIFSIWDFPNKKQIIASYKDAETFVGGFGGEGTGLHSHNDFGWLPDHWYTNIVRCWSTNDSVTNVGYWLYDQSANTWKHYVTFVVPQAFAVLKGNISSFLENFADDEKRTRSAEYRNYWIMQPNGEWKYPDTLIASAGKGSWSAKQINNDCVELTSCGTEIGKDKYKFPITMLTSRPAIIKKAVVDDAGAYYDKEHNLIYVDWVISPNDMPQLSYKVSLFDNEACKGNPLAETSGIDPDITMAILHTRKVDLKQQNYYVQVKIIDIFNQPSEEKISTIHELHP